MMSATVEDRLVNRLRYTETIPLLNGQYEGQWVDLAKVKEILERLGFDLDLAPFFSPVLVRGSG